MHPPDTISYDERLAQIIEAQPKRGVAETEAQRTERLRLEYAHNHHRAEPHTFLQGISRPQIDGAEPIDEESGLRISPVTLAWQYPFGHSRYRPHPDSFAFQSWLDQRNNDKTSKESA